MPAGAALIDMAAERGGPTPGQRAEDGPLLHAEPRMLIEEVLTLRVEDIGHLHGGPAHDCGGLPLQTGPRHHRGRCARAAAQADWAPRGGGVARGGDTPSCATGRRGRAGAESCAGRRPLPADASRRCAGACGA